MEGDILLWTQNWGHNLTIDFCAASIVKSERYCMDCKIYKDKKAENLNCDCP